MKKLINSIHLRVSQQLNELIDKSASEEGLTKATFVRTVLIKYFYNKQKHEKNESKENTR